MEVGALSALALSSLIALGDAGSVESWDTVDTYELPAIAGLWVMEVGDTPVCREQYNFGKNGVLTTVSHQEKTKGSYNFVYGDVSPLPMLAMTTDFDNNQADCSGQQIDQTGNTMGVFVKLNSRHAPTKMQWCQDPNGKVCVSELYRVLP